MDETSRIVAVTQEDRDAAAAYARDRFSDDLLANEIARGTCDATSVTVQAFARHREQATASLRASLQATAEAAAAHCRTAASLREERDALREETDRLEVAVGWLADVSAATAYGLGEIKSTSKSERRRQLSIMEKVIAILDGHPAPTRGAQDGVRARCDRTRAALSSPLGEG